MTVKREITEGAPLSYTADDGAVIVVSVAGPERVFTLTVSGERIDSSTSEAWIRYQARGHAESHDARGGKVPASAPEIDGYEPAPIDLDELRAELADTTPAQIESPLPVDEQRSSGLAGGGASANAMSAPVREMLDSARTAFDGQAWRGRLRDGNYPVTMLKAAARRGWLELDDKIRPSWGRLTDAGRRALARYDAKHGTTNGAR